MKLHKPNSRLAGAFLAMVLAIGTGYVITASHAATLLGDIDNNGAVNIFDLSALLSQWGKTGANTADLNNSGSVDIFDVSALLAHWGETGTPSQTPTPTATATPSATPTTGAVINGEQINASNTGIAGAGLSATNLTSQGATTYGTSFNGQTVSNIHFSGTVVINASNFTLKNCLVTPPGGANEFGIHIFGANVTIDHCTVAPSSSYLYEGVLFEAAAGGSVVQRSDISFAENNISFYQTGGVTVQYSYLHDAKSSVAGAHVDNIEAYGGTNSTIAFNRIVTPASGDLVSEINIAPWGGRKIDGLNITDNFLDGAHYHILDDGRPVQGGSGIFRVRVLRNTMGGHNDIGGQYLSLINFAAPMVQTEAALTATPTAILWPNTGADANHWDLCTDLTPDKTGQIIVQ